MWRWRRPTCRVSTSESGSAATRIRATRDLSLLYASKVGALLVGLFVLPAFNRELGAQAFGIAAVIFSIQALLLILDLGTSTVVGRNIAAAPDHNPAALPTLQTGTRIIAVLYAVLIPTAVALNAVLNLQLGLAEVLGSMLMFWSLTAQNVGQSALLARRHFAAASSLQFIGATLRAVVTLGVLHFVSPTLMAFVWAQAGCAGTHWAVTYALCHRYLRIGGATVPTMPIAGPRMSDFLLQGRSLMLFGLAGAAVLHLDKVIVSAFVSPAALAPYFLATSLCMTPLTALAGPVSQFFQPRLVREMAAGTTMTSGVTLSHFVDVIAMVTLLPSGALWLLREPIAGAWLANTGTASQVAIYTGILLPGLAVGALGYVPYGILVARQDYRFQAWMSVSLTVVTLTAAMAAAWAGSIVGLCLVYALYHAVSTLASWLRCLHLLTGDELGWARAAAFRTCIAVGGSALITANIALSLRSR